jgi:hypothetical protein
MSMLTSGPSALAIESVPGSLPSEIMPPEVVEVGLLLPKDWALALVKLSARRQQTVAQLLRSLVERAIFQGESAT